MIVLRAKDGPQIGQPIDVPAPGRSIGGRGSRSDINLSGVPAGLDLIVLEIKAGAWHLREVKPRTVLLNGKRLMRVNQISDQDEITLPGLNHGDTIRYGVEVDASAITDVANRKSDKKKKEEASAFKLSPAMMIGGGVYLAILIGAGLFFALRGGDSSDVVPFSKADLIAAIDEDIAQIREGSGSVGTTGLLGRPRSFDDLGIYFASRKSEDEKASGVDAFRTEILDDFFTAWRLEQQNRWDEALLEYESLLQRASDRNLKTTNITLERLEWARANSGT